MIKKLFTSMKVAYEALGVGALLLPSPVLFKHIDACTRAKY